MMWNTEAIALCEWTFVIDPLQGRWTNGVDIDTLLLAQKWRIMIGMAFTCPAP